MKELMTALAEFQKDCPLIPREKEGYNYKYASLDKIHEIIKPIMQKLGLVISQCVESEGNEQFTIKTILYHLNTGQNIESKFTSPIVSLGKMNDYQSLGSGITYMRRYTLSAILNLVTEDDKDAAGEQTKKEPTKFDKKIDDKPWLNQKTKKWDLEVDNLKKGIKTINQLKTEYRFTALNAKELEKQSGNTKPELLPKMPEWQKAIDYLKSDKGAKIEDIEKKYSISKENRESLAFESI